MNIQNRRYTGSKYKLMPWIKQLIVSNCKEHETIFDVFGGTGVVTAELLEISKTNIINDFLYSNEVIYKAFFGKEKYSKKKLENIKLEYNSIKGNTIKENYVSKNYGNKYFKYNDSKIIGYIREDILNKLNKKEINNREYNILLASLLYSLDRISNTVGHYEAYFKESNKKPNFVLELIDPIETNNKIKIYRKDSNELAKHITADIAFIDPPYNSRQYSRFYHVLETITKWDKPKLSGEAMKPPIENMSDYCRASASEVFKDLINKLNVKYIVVTYNNTYDSKSSSSKNKISLEEISSILKDKGSTKIFKKEYKRFNAGKTQCDNHKEYVFITKVKK